MSHRTLPYLPFAVFIDALDVLSKEPPEQVDKSCWSRIPSLKKNGQAVFDIFRYLGLVSETGGVLPPLRQVLDVQTRSTTLATLVRTRYKFQIPEHLRTATMDHLKKAFEQNAGGREAMGRKALSFYLNAAQLAGFQLHTNLVPRGPRVAAKKTPAAAPVSGAPALDNELVFASRGLQGGGVIAIKISGQSLESLTASELAMATAAAMEIKDEPQAPEAAAAPIRRPPENEKGAERDKKSRRA